MIYTSVLSAVVSALAAEAIDNTSKQAWQKLYNPHDDEGADLASLSRSCAEGEIDRSQVDCWVFSRLHSCLLPRHWDALVAKYSTHKGRKVEAIGALRPIIATPAPSLFLYKAITTWAIPKLKGARIQLAPSIAVQVPVDASPTKQAAIVQAAMDAERVNRKKLESRSADMIVLRDSFYDMNTWDPEANPESTRREWRRKIHKVLDEMVKEALTEAGRILELEGVLTDKAA